jgi:putative ABC transport system permease protein
MNWMETFRTGLEAIRSHRLRSGLTMLGILVGIAAVILSVGLGEGAAASVRSSINALGSNLLVVTPGSSTSLGGIRGGLGSASTLTLTDANALSSKTVAPDVAGAAPVVQQSLTVTATGTNWTTTVVGTTRAWLPVRARTVTEGRFLTAHDLAGTSAVAVLGTTTASELFPGRDPVGQTITVNSVPLDVVGVLNSVGASGGASNLDDQVVVPITTTAQRIFGGATRDSVSSIYIAASDSSTLSAAYQEVQNELLALHHISNPSSADFSIASQQSLLTTISSVNKTLTVLLAGIAAISLLVGGIGVMNIMLVSVTERFREIGLRKAVGATPRAILFQFLVESSVLALAGGVLGAGLGILAAIGLPHVISNTITLSPAATIGSIVVAIGIGIGFGVYPASRAARLEPIDALRFE